MKGKKAANNENYWARDGVSVSAAMYFGWKDRLRILLGCGVVATTRIETQWRVGDVSGKTIFEIEKYFAKLRRTDPDAAAEMEAVTPPRVPDNHDATTE